MLILSSPMSVGELTNRIASFVSSGLRDGVQLMEADGISA